MVKIFYMSIVFILFSCSKEKKEKIENVIIITENKYLSIYEGFEINNREDFIRGKNNYELVYIKDTIKFEITEEEKNIINKSFIQNKIEYISKNNMNIGEKVEYIIMPKKINIKTNRRNIDIEYNYFLDEVKIDKIKTMEINNFLRTIDSILHYK